MKEAVPVAWVCQDSGHRKEDRHGKELPEEDVEVEEKAAFGKTGRGVGLYEDRWNGEGATGSACGRTSERCEGSLGVAVAGGWFAVGSVDDRRGGPVAGRSTLRSRSRCGRHPLGSG